MGENRLLNVHDLANTMSRNMGVLQTTVAEIVTIKEHQRKCRPWTQRQAALTLPSSSLCNHAFCLVSWVGPPFS